MTYNLPAQLIEHIKRRSEILGVSNTKLARAVFRTGWAHLSPMSKKELLEHIKE